MRSRKANKQLTNSIKELEDFSKSFGQMNINELEKLKGKISEDMQSEKEDKEQDDDDEFVPSFKSQSYYSSDTTNRMTIGQSDSLNNTLDLGDEYSTPDSRKTFSTISPQHNKDFEEYLKKFK
jgi:hypothetical protein